MKLQQQPKYNFAWEKIQEYDYHTWGRREKIQMWFLNEKYFWIYNVNPQKKYAKREMMKQSIYIIDISDIADFKV